MKLFSATVLLFLAVASSHPLEEEFEQFLADYGKEYYRDEYYRRQKIFHRNLETITKHNAKRTESNSNYKSNYTMGVNIFADMLPDELPLGYDKSLHSAWKTMKSSSSAVERNLGLEDAEMDPKNSRVRVCKNIDCAVQQPCACLVIYLYTTVVAYTCDTLYIICCGSLLFRFRFSSPYRFISWSRTVLISQFPMLWIGEPAKEDTPL